MHKTKDLFKGFAHRPLLWILLGILASLYLQSFVLPHTPIYQGDTVPLYLLEAKRMLEGQVIYRDFFEFVFPGTQLLYLVLLKLFGTQAWIPSATLVGLGVSLGWTGVAISKRLMSGKLVFLPGLLFVGFAFSSERDPTHHWYSTLAVMAALVLLIEARTPWRIAGAGACCALATLFTQSRGVVAVLGVAIFLLWEWRAKQQSWRRLVKAEFCLCAGFLAILLPVVAYFVRKVPWGQLVYCTFIFLTKYWNKWYWNSFQTYMSEFPVLTFWLRLPALGIYLFIHALLPFVYLLFLMRYRRNLRARPEEPWDRLMLVNIVGLSLFFGIASSPNWLRLCSVSLPALIVFVWFIKSPGKLCRALRGLLWVAAVTVLVGEPVMVQTGWHGYLDSPTGRAAFLEPERYEVFRWVRDNTQDGDSFYQVADCDLYYLLDLRNPTEMSFVTNTDFTRPEQIQNVVEALEKRRVRLVLWSIWLNVPRPDRLDRDHLGALRAYLDSHYHVIKSLGPPDFEQVWERNSDLAGLSTGAR